MRELAESQYRRRVTENQNPRPRRLTGTHPSARLGLVVRTLAALLAGIVLLLPPASSVRAAEPYAGPLVDAHSHLPNLQVLDALVAAMDRHKVARVALLGVGGVQKDDAAWIETAARRFPDRVIPFAPVRLK